ncbi:MAG TPA: GH25 family lysozyme [Bacteroidia bacterium]|jgi:GH25 family lysozyme M1 (1,4-beta-N-acetylmuramidase)|nr:GH25 family lysozyme [Bacteroidia bacterium]
MKKLLLSMSMCIVVAWNIQAQECLSTGFCTTSTNQYPTSTFSTSSSTWTTVSAYMNAGNYTLFNVTSGNVYEWTYCEAYGGVSTNWDAQLTLTNNATSANLCFSDNNCGTTGKAPYISWTANFTGVVKLLTTVSNCTSNTGSPYNTLVWRQANGTVGSSSILGLDVSHYQGTVNWTQVKGAGKTFAWAKSTEGINITDANFAGNATNGVAAGMYVCAYHFAHPLTNSAASEASFFLSVAGSYIKSCNLMPALDLEDPSGGPSLTTMSSANLTAWVQAWMTAVKNQTGITPVLYVNGSIATYLGSGAHAYNLWIADPDGSSTAPPANIGSWSTWTFKQYSFTGTCTGVSGQIDLDVFNGDLNALKSLMGCLATTVTEETVMPEFKLFPNPANDHITIENVVFNENENETISVYNMQGQLILEQHVQQRQTEIDISNFKNGLYIVRLQSPQGMQTKKFLKQ